MRISPRMRQLATILRTTQWCFESRWSERTSPRTRHPTKAHNMLRKEAQGERGSPLLEAATVTQPCVPLAASWRPPKPPRATPPPFKVGFLVFESRGQCFQFGLSNQG